MNSARLGHQNYLSRPTWRNRLVSVLLAAAATLLIALLMLMMGTLLPGRQAQVAPLVAIEIPRDAQAKPAHAHTARQHAAAAAASPTPQPRVPPRAVKPPVPVVALLHLSKQDFAASDIGKLSGHAQSGSGSSGSGSTYGPGDGPGGVALRDGEWYDDPYQAIAFYLHKDQEPKSWGTIACRMAEHDRVEDCRELDESLGSGMARAMRQAAWKFRVRPPSVNGRPTVGIWVRLKFTLTTTTTGSDQPESLPGADNGP